MKPLGHIAGLCGIVLVAAGCVQKVDIEVTAIELVDSLPVGRTDIQGHEDLRAGNLKIAEAGFVRVQFRTKTDLRHEAAEHNTSAYVRPCDPSSDHGSNYIEHSGIFLDDGGYAAFFPARLGAFVRQDSDGGFVLGWPDETLTNGLCFQVAGLDMMRFGLQSDEIELDRMAELLKR